MNNIKSLDLFLALLPLLVLLFVIHLVKAAKSPFFIYLPMPRIATVSAATFRPGEWDLHFSSHETGSICLFRSHWNQGFLHIHETLRQASETWSGILRCQWLSHDLTNIKGTNTTTITSQQLNGVRGGANQSQEQQSSQSLPYPLDIVIQFHSLYLWSIFYHSSPSVLLTCQQ